MISTCCAPTLRSKSRAAWAPTGSCICCDGRAPKRSLWRGATFETIRRCYVKIAVRVEEMKTHIRLAFSASYPHTGTSPRGRLDRCGMRRLPPKPAVNPADAVRLPLNGIAPANRTG
jgi:hypothetical protein